jgi:hypothetical protein
MRFSYFREVVAGCAAVVLLTLVPGASTQEPEAIRQRVQGAPAVAEESPTSLVWWGSGWIRTPKGDSWVNLRVRPNEAGTFSGVISYRLGLRQQDFRFKGTVYRDMVLFTEEDTEGAVQLGAPTSGGGRFEGRLRGTTLKGVARLRTWQGGRESRPGDTVEVQGRFEFQLGPTDPFDAARMPVPQRP